MDMDKSSIHPSEVGVSIHEEGLPPYSHAAATFDTASSPEHYKPISTYEGAHRYDPSFEWDPNEESRLVRKVWTTKQ